MAQFFKFLFASCLGTLLALLVLFFFTIGGLSGLIGSQQQAIKIKPNSVLHLKLDQAVPELMDNVDNPPFDLNAPSILGLHDILQSIEVAATDDNIKGIFLESSIVMTGFTANAAIREALLSFRESGKFVVAYAPFYSQGAYYLATASEEINLAPLGIVDWRGLSAQYPFFKDMLDRIGVKFEVFYAGKYKSASEPYRRNSMSPENREQTRAFLDELWRLMLDDVAATRKLSTSELRELANTYTGIKTEAALSSGLVDRVVYREAVIDGLQERLGLDEDDKVELVKLADFHAAKVATQRNTEGGKIAVLIAEGIIIDGKGQAAQIGDKTYVKLIEEIAEDDKVKAVVLRINSPGGSAMASDHIWQALMDLKGTGKPLV
ncbi:MAG: signal peptide peptidase SppA, partial [Bacteroidetes bacterium]